MLRRLFTVASVLSLLLAVATVALWAVSQVRGCRVQYTSGGWWYADAAESEGRLEVTYSPYEPPSVPPYRRLSRRGPLTPTPPLVPPPRRWRWASFEPAPLGNFRGMQPIVRLPWAGLWEEHSDTPQWVEGVGTRTGRSANYVLLTRLEPVAGLFCLLPACRVAVGVRRSRRLRRRRTGHCAACGYDLRASNQRCPECGMPVGEMTGSAN